MTTTYTPSLRFPVMTAGDPTVTNAWGTILATFMSVCEEAITGNAAIDIGGTTSYTLSVLNNAIDQARSYLYNFTGALTAACTVTIPQVAKVGWAANNTTGGFDVILTTGASGGTNVTIPPGQTVGFNCDGTNISLPQFGNPFPSAARVPGETAFYLGIAIPSLWYAADGRAFSRTTFSALFNALTFQTTANITNNSNQITNVQSLAGNEIVMGGPVEGPGIPTGTIAQSFTGTGPYTVTMSQNATASSTGATISFLPHGQGDGSTTFNLPDLRGCVPAGMDAFNDASVGPASNLSGVLASTQMGLKGGSQYQQQHTHTLNLTDPGHTHTVTDPGHTHTVTDPGHTHTISDPGHNHGMADGANPYAATGALGFTNVGGSGVALEQTTIANHQTGVTNLSTTTGISNQSHTTGVTNQSTTTGITGSNANTGTGNAQNLQPLILGQFIIFAGA